MTSNEPRFAHATAAQLGVRPFLIPGCARCGARLADQHGNPRWEIVGKLAFICLGGCRGRAQARVQKAALL